MRWRPVTACASFCAGGGHGTFESEYFARCIGRLMAFALPRQFELLRDQTGAVGSRFAAWWWSELKACLPDRWRALSLGLTGAPVQISFAGDEMHLTGPRGSRVLTMEPLATPGANSARLWESAQGLTANAKTPTGFELVLPVEKFLVRDVRIPAAARSRLDLALRKDMELRTPLKAADVFASHEVLGQLGETLRIRQIILKRSTVTELLVRLGLETRHVTAIRAGGESQASWAAIQPTWDHDHHGANETSLRRVAIGLWLSLPLLGLALAWTVVHRQEAEIAALELEQRGLRAKAVAVRQAADKLASESAGLAAIRARKVDEPDARDMIEDLTRLLPDSAWLTELRIGDKETVIAGYSPGAANLVPLLARSQIFQSAALNAPIVIDPVENRERFSIVLRHKPGPAGSGPSR
jgi:general secretion pathway protein L